MPILLVTSPMICEDFVSPSQPDAQLVPHAYTKSGGMSQNLSFSSPTLATRTPNAFYSQPQESTTREYKTETPLISNRKN
jgi:hypothetical protein